MAITSLHFPVTSHVLRLSLVEPQLGSPGMLRAKRACIPCKGRKVKCNSEIPCQQCTHLGLKCDYPDPSPSNRSRKGLNRGHVVAEYQSRSLPNATLMPLASRDWDEQSSSATTLTRNHSPDDSVFDPAFFESLVIKYEQRVFPILPVIYTWEIHEAIKSARENREDKAFLYAFAAVTTHMSRIDPQERGDARDKTLTLCLKALEMRGSTMPHHAVSVRSIMTADFISCCLLANPAYVDMAFFYLREAITKLQLLRVDAPEGAHNIEPAEQHRRQRLYWLLYAHERFIAISHYRTVVLSPLPFLPQINDTIDILIQNWLVNLVKVFSLVDHVFVDNWLNKGSGSSITLSWIEDKHHQLQELELENQNTTILDERHHIDLVITEYWLRTLIWQMALSKCLLSSNSSIEITSLLFPMQLSSRLRYLLDNRPTGLSDKHGTCMLQKIFDITNTIADILINVSSAATDEDTTKCIDDFSFLHDYLVNESRFDLVERQILADKFEQMCRIFPGRHRSFSSVNDSVITDLGDTDGARRYSAPSTIN